MHHYVCLLNSRFLLIALAHFLCILIGQFCFNFLFLFQSSESAIFVAIFYEHVSSGGRLVLYSCSSLLAIFGYGLFICIQASHFDLCDHVPTRYHVAKFSHECEKLHWQFGKYFFNISEICHRVIKVLSVHNNLFKVRKFPASKFFLTINY